MLFLPYLLRPANTANAPANTKGQRQIGPVLARAITIFKASSFTIPCFASGSGSGVAGSWVSSSGGLEFWRNSIIAASRLGPPITYNADEECWFVGNR